MRLELARLAESHGIARLTWGGEVIALRTAPMQRFGKALLELQRASRFIPTQAANYRGIEAAARSAGLLK